MQKIKRPLERLIHKASRCHPDSNWRIKVLQTNYRLCSLAVYLCNIVCRHGTIGISDKVLRLETFSQSFKCIKIHQKKSLTFSVHKHVFNSSYSAKRKPDTFRNDPDRTGLIFFTPSYPLSLISCASTDIHEAC